MDFSFVASPNVNVSLVTKIIRLDSFDQIALLAESGGLSTWCDELRRGGVISIGNFDGVHLGHVSLFNRVRELAVAAKVSAIAVSFDPHPATVLRPDLAPKRLMTMERRAEIMSYYGIDQLVICEVTESFLKLSAKEFFNTLVIDLLKAKAMVEGPNFFFGRDREGDQDLLARFCEQHQIGLEITDSTEHSQQMISSSRIRSLLADGKVEEASKLLSHPYQICGTVISGDCRGREIGFPTANLGNIEVLVPDSGVYGGIATVRGKEFLAAIHVGSNPTFHQENQQKIEVHLIDFEEDIYGLDVRVDFLFRLRNVIRFTSIEELVAQVEQDVQAVRNYAASK